MDLNLEELEASYTGADFTKKQAARMVNDKVNQLIWGQNLGTRDDLDSLRADMDHKMDSLRNFLVGAIAVGTAIVAVAVGVVGFLAVMGPR